MPNPFSDKEKKRLREICRVATVSVWGSDDIHIRLANQTQDGDWVEVSRIVLDQDATIEADRGRIEEFKKAIDLTEKIYLKKIKKLNERIEELQTSVDFHDKITEAHYFKYIELGEIWARVAGKEGTIPDTGRLLDWLAEYIAELETALEPFSEMAKGFHPDHSSEALVISTWDAETEEEDKYKLYVKDFRIARAAREGGKK